MEKEKIRLNKVLRELNISLARAVEYLSGKGIVIIAKPHTKISESEYEILLDGFQTDARKKIFSDELRLLNKKKKEGENRLQKVKHEPSIIRVNQHRKFILEENKGTFTIIRDVISNLTYTYKALYLPVGSKIILKVEHYDVLAGKPSFDYSVLNTYQVDETYVFKVIQKKENGYEIVNNEMFRSFFIPLSFGLLITGNSIKLKIESIDLEKNRLNFNAPNLNNADNFVIDKEYEFDVVGSNEIDSDFACYKLRYNDQLYTVKMFSAQKSLPHPTKLICRVNEIKFGKVYLHQVSNNQNIITSSLSKGETYDFEVIERKDIDEDYSLFILKHEDDTFKIKLFDYQKKIATPARVKCYVYDIKYGSTLLHFSKHFLISQLYTVGEKYRFEIVSEEKYDDYSYVLLNDEYGFSHRLYNSDYIANDYLKIRTQDSCELYVKQINATGFLTLYVEEVNSTVHFFKAEDVFDELGFDINTYFFSYKYEYEKALKGYESPINSNNNQQNLWLFSYLSFIHKSIIYKINSSEYEIALDLLNLYIQFEEWMIEGSSFLDNFSSSKKESIIFKAESQLSRAKNRVKALNIIISPDKDKYIDTTLKRLTISGRLTDEKLKVLKEVLLSSNELYKRKVSEIDKIISKLQEANLIEDYDAGAINRVLEHLHNTEIKKINSCLSIAGELLDGAEFDNIDNILNIIKLKIRLALIANDQVLKSYNESMFFKILSLKTESNSIKKILLINAIIVIVDTDMSESLSLDSHNPLNYKLLSSSKTLSNNAKKLYHNNGLIGKTEKGWALFTRNMQISGSGAVNIKYVKLTSFFNDTFIIATGHAFDTDVLEVNFSSGKKSWDGLYSYTTSKKKKLSEASVFPPDGSEIECVMKLISRTQNKNYSFLEVSDSEYSGDGILHFSNSFGFYEVQMDKLIYPGERLVLDCSINIANNVEKLNFNLLDKIWEITRGLHKVNDLVVGQVVSVSSNTYKIITENGCLSNVAFVKTELLQNHTYEFKIIDRDEKNKFFVTELIGRSAQKINGHDKLRELLLRELIIADTLDENESDDFEASSHGLVAIRSIINGIEALINIEIELDEKVRLLNLLKVLASIIKDSKSYYADAKLNYIDTIDAFTKLDASNVFLVDSFIDENTIDIYNDLEQCNLDYEKLALFNKKGILNQELILNANDKLSGLIMAHNILADQSSDMNVLKMTKSIIDAFLFTDRLDSSIVQNKIILETTETEEVAVVEEVQVNFNLGRESKYREFKTSFVFYAGSNSGNIEKQSFVILRTIVGFLNADGGSLFIGVNDKGEVAGLINDYNALGSNIDHDFYERRVRKEIVRNLNKDINGQLEFVFKTFNDAEYLEIVIPAYFEAVSLGDKFYQRQGNETRELLGYDIIKFVSRKFLNNPDAKTFKKDYYEDQKIENTPIVKPVSNYGDALAYFHLKYNGSYFISEIKQSAIDVKYILPISESVKRGFLLQGYDNGCVNKVPVRIILDKKYNYIYSKGVSNEGNLIMLELVANDDIIIKINTFKNEVQYVKLYPIKKISEHNILYLKGNQVVPKDIDYVVAYASDFAKHAGVLSKLIYDSSMPIGKAMNSKNYQPEFTLLNQL